jgi:predicted nicotinamide N-methyase
VTIKAANGFAVAIRVTSKRTTVAGQALLDLVEGHGLTAAIDDTAIARYQVSITDLEAMQRIRRRLVVMAEAVAQGGELIELDDPTVFSIQAKLWRESAEALEAIAAGPSWWRRLWTYIFGARPSRR